MPEFLLLREPGAVEKFGQVELKLSGPFVDEGEAAVGPVPEEKGLGLGEVGQEVAGKSFFELFVEMLQSLETKVEGVAEGERRVKYYGLVEDVVVVPAEGGNSKGVPVVIVDEVRVAGAGGFHFNYRGGVQLGCPAAGCVLEVENPYYSLIVIWKGQTPTRRSTSS